MWNHSPTSAQTHAVRMRQIFHSKPASFTKRFHIKKFGLEGGPGNIREVARRVGLVVSNRDKNLRAFCIRDPGARATL
jgi:hypothetical protein